MNLKNIYFRFLFIFCPGGKAKPAHIRSPFKKLRKKKNTYQTRNVRLAIV